MSRDIALGPVPPSHRAHRPESLRARAAVGGNTDSPALRKRPGPANGIRTNRPDGLRCGLVQASLSRSGDASRSIRSIARQSGLRPDPASSGRSSTLPTSRCFRRFPTARLGAEGDEVAASVGRAMAPILEDVQTRAHIRVTDHRGVVVATNNGDLGTNLSAADEVSSALAGFERSRLRRIAGTGRPSISAFVRGAAVRVIVTRPIVLHERVIGAVVGTQTPSNILVALPNQTLPAATGPRVCYSPSLSPPAIFASRTLARPIRRLVGSAERVAAGDAVKIDVDRYRRPWNWPNSPPASRRWRRVCSIEPGTSAISPAASVTSSRHRFAAMSGTLEVLADHLDDMTPGERRHFIDNLNPATSADWNRSRGGCSNSRAPTCTTRTRACRRSPRCCNPPSTATWR